jgi:MSHA biogenesis protein MshK
MAGGLNMPGRRAMRAVLLVAVMATGVLAAQAESLRDPTRPPISMGSGGPGGEKGVRPGWVLQSVLISPQRRFAIINGEIVAPGQSVGGAELVALAEGRATLRTADGLRTVDLFPDVVRGDSESRAANAKQKKDVQAESGAATDSSAAKPGSQR